MYLSLLSQINSNQPRQARMTERMIVETTPTKLVIVSLAHRDVDLSLTDRQPRSGYRTSARHPRTPVGRCGSTDTRAPPWWSHLSIEQEGLPTEGLSQGEGLCVWRGSSVSFNRSGGGPMWVVVTWGTSLVGRQPD